MENNAFLEDAIARIRSMPIDEFEARCVRAGLISQKKDAAINIYGHTTFDCETYAITYMRSVPVSSQAQEGFGFLFSSTNPLFSVAAA